MSHRNTSGQSPKGNRDPDLPAPVTCSRGYIYPGYNPSELTIASGHSHWPLSPHPTTLSGKQLSEKMQRIADIRQDQLQQQIRSLQLDVEEERKTHHSAPCSSEPAQEVSPEYFYQQSTNYQPPTVSYPTLPSAAFYPKLPTSSSSQANAGNSFDLAGNARNPDESRADSPMSRRA